jgi:hypothetical protein
MLLSTINSFGHAVKQFLITAGLFFWVPMVNSDNLIRKQQSDLEEDRQ